MAQNSTLIDNTNQGDTLITPTQLTEYVTGSGAFGYAPWWTDMQPDGFGGIFLHAANPDPDDFDLAVVVFRLTPGKIRNTFVRLVMEGHPCFEGVDMDDPDIDAEMGDVILQEAAFGETVYG